jgi:hypothetical protein
MDGSRGTRAVPGTLENVSYGNILYGRSLLDYVSSGDILPMCSASGGPWYIIEQGYVARIRLSEQFVQYLLQFISNDQAFL